MAKPIWNGTTVRKDTGEHVDPKQQRKRRPASKRKAS